MDLKSMNELYNSKIMEVLLENRCGEFENVIMKEDKNSEEALEKIAEKYEKIMKNIIQDKANEVKEELDMSFEDILDYTYYWIKQYYKLGIADGINIKSELVEIIEKYNGKDIKKDGFEKSIVDNINTELTMFIDDYFNEVLEKNEEYKKLEDERIKLKEDYPRVTKYIEDDAICDFTKAELKALLRIIELESYINTIQTQEAFKLGIREKFL